MQDFQIRFALDSDGPALKAFLAARGQDVEGIEFVGIEGFWLIVETDRIVGCGQLGYSRPYGMAENLYVDPALQPYEAAKVAKMLMDSGMSVLKYMGSDGIASQIPFENKRFKKALKKRGWAAVSAGNLMMRRL